MRTVEINDIKLPNACAILSKQVPSPLVDGNAMSFPLLHVLSEDDKSMNPNIYQEASGVPLSWTSASFELHLVTPPR